MENTIEIFGHMIKRDEIIGISALRVKATTDPAMWSLYGAKKLFFHVHTKQNSIEIDSDYFKVSSIDEKEALDERKAYNEWAGEYKKLKELIKLMLSPAPPEDLIEKYKDWKPMP
jgi:hypothetical protein